MIIWLLCLTEVRMNKGSKWAAGDIMYKDLDGNGVIHEGKTITDPGTLK